MRVPQPALVFEVTAVGGEDLLQRLERLWVRFDANGDQVFDELTEAPSRPWPARPAGPTGQHYCVHSPQGQVRRAEAPVRQPPVDIGLQAKVARHGVLAVAPLSEALGEPHRVRGQRSGYAVLLGLFMMTSPSIGKAEVSTQRSRICRVAHRRAVTSPAITEARPSPPGIFLKPEFFGLQLWTLSGRA